MRKRALGIFMIVIGIVGLLTGVVPLVINALRIVADDAFLEPLGLAGHGVEAMGLSVEWAMLSSAMGTYLGILLLWGGISWVKAHRNAATITWCYILCGLLVNIVDMIIFVFYATPGNMRTHMLYFDAIALAIPILLAGWLLIVPEVYRRV